MKKLLIILPLLFVIATAWSQDSDINKNKVKHTAVDGKSYKITLHSLAMNDKSHDMGNKNNAIDPVIETTPDKMSNNKDMTEDMKSSQVQKDVDLNSLDNKTMIIKLDNGIMHSSLLKSSNMDNCPYSVSNTATAMLAFNATCIQNNQGASKATYTWDGTIDGKNISGNLTKKIDNGKTVTYSFTGSETDASDSKDLGIK